MYHSNTTLVSINLEYNRQDVYVEVNSNTTLVSINLVNPPDEEKSYEFKYNSCFY